MPRIPKEMTGVLLPGNSTVKFAKFPVPDPVHAQVLIQMKASSICGSDIRCIYREHTGKGAEGYQNVIAGHEPAGLVVKLGPACRSLKLGDRVSVYHISGCGCCPDCQHGYQISCQSPTHRKAYGWQRDGGHAPYMIADECDCVVLPDNLSYVDGAYMACGTGTAWECLNRMHVSGRDRLLVAGLGPVGLAAAQLGRVLGVTEVFGFDLSEGRLKHAKSLQYKKGVPLIDHVLKSDSSTLATIKKLTRGAGCEVSIDCSGAAPARLLALEGTRQWGRCGFVGEGSTISFEVSEALIHPQITLFGSWVGSLRGLIELAEILGRLDVHPEATGGPKLPLSEAPKAYDLADKAQTGKVCIVFED